MEMMRGMAREMTREMGRRSSMYPCAARYLGGFLGLSQCV